MYQIKIFLNNVRQERPLYEYRTSYIPHVDDMIKIKDKEYKVRERRFVADGDDVCDVTLVVIEYTDFYF